MDPGERSSSRWRPLSLLGLLGVIAFALRALYVWSVWDSPAIQLPVIDAEAYRLRALEILGGEWRGHGVYYLDPLYPFFLAALYSVVGPDSIGVLIAQAILDSLSVVLVASIARSVFDDRTAWVAGAIAGAYALFFYYDALLLKAPLMIFLVVSSLHLVVRAAEADRPTRWLPAGLLIGLAGLTRANTLLFAPVLFGWIVFRGSGDLRRRGLSAGLLTLGVLCVIAPVTLRNYVVGGDLVLMNSQAGQNFYIGNFRGNDTGAYRAPAFLRPNPEVEEEDFAREAETQVGRTMRPSEISRYWLMRGVEEIRADPAHFFRHVLRKALVFANTYEVPDNMSYEYFRRHVSSMLALPFPTWGAVFPLTLCGMFFARRNRLAMPLILFFITYTSGILIFFNLSRLRLPVVPVAIVFAAHALFRIRDLVRERHERPKPLLTTLAFLLAAYPVVHLDVIHQDLNIRYFNMGRAFLGRADAAWKRAEALEAAGDAEAAREAYDEVARDRGEAEAQFRLGLEHDPDYARLDEGLRRSMLLRIKEAEHLGRDEVALHAAREFTETFPDHPIGHVRLGLLHEKLGAPHEAAQAFARALELRPGHRVARAGLARVRGEALPEPARSR